MYNFATLLKKRVVLMYWVRLAAGSKSNIYFYMTRLLAAVITRVFQKLTKKIHDKAMLFY